MNRFSPYEKRRIAAAAVLAAASGLAIGVVFGWRMTTRPPVTTLPGVQR